MQAEGVHWLVLWLAQAAHSEGQGSVLWLVVTLLVWRGVRVNEQKVTRKGV